MNTSINLNLKNIWLFCLMAFAMVISPRAHAEEDQFTSFQKDIVDNIKWMQKNLDLTSDQLKRIDLIQTNIMADAGSLRASNVKNHKAKLTEYNQLRDSFNDQMKSVLTPEQWSKYDQHLMGIKNKNIEKMDMH